MKAVVLNISIEQRVPWSQRFAVEQKVNGVYVPFPLTGWSGISSIKTSTSSAESLATPTVSIVDVDGGLGEISITGAQSAAIKVTGRTFADATYGVWDAYLVHPTSPLSPMRLFNGSVSISPSASEP